MPCVRTLAAPTSQCSSPPTSCTFNGDVASVVCTNTPGDGSQFTCACAPGYRQLAQWANFGGPPTLLCAGAYGCGRRGEEGGGEGSVFCCHLRSNTKSRSCQECRAEARTPFLHTVLYAPYTHVAQVHAYERWLAPTLARSYPPRSPHPT